MYLHQSYVEIDPPKKPKRVTGTKLASILGLNRYSTPFAAWCDITRTYQDPFIDSIYTIAGKIIEPKQAKFIKEVYKVKGLMTPEDVYGPDPFKKTYGNFFKNAGIFGGMWDALWYEGDRLEAVVEFKTTKNPDQWDEDVPEHYALQAALYAHLLGCDRVVFGASFLGPSDYENPDSFVPTIHNTIVREFYVSERYPEFQATLDSVQVWWNSYVLTGVSPEFNKNNRGDKKILDAICTKAVEADATLDTLLEEAEELQKKMEQVTDTHKADQDRLTFLKDQIKEKLSASLSESKTSATAGKWKLSTTEVQQIDKQRMAKDGILDKYLTTVLQTRLTRSKE